jgi:phosphatidylglycerol:prolipoprotein diacylglycerol transferase
VSTVFHPALHTLFEALAYSGGYAVYRRLRAHSNDVLSDERRWIVIAAAAMGALIGGRVLGILEQAPREGFHWAQLILPGGGKTIVGGLLGGWLSVELVKRIIGIRSRTGDLFAVPLCIGIAIGRIGCFFAGLADDTFGKPTSLPWGVDFGDGISRHPTQLYELLFLLLLAWLLYDIGRARPETGTVFRVFITAYLGWRLLIDFIKPQPLVGGMNVIQWACLAGLLYLTAEWILIGRTRYVSPAT